VGTTYLKIRFNFCLALQVFFVHEQIGERLHQWGMGAASQQS
jgi:hypothetical protein